MKIFYERNGDYMKIMEEFDVNALDKNNEKIRVHCCLLIDYDKLNRPKRFIKIGDDLFELNTGVVTLSDGIKLTKVARHTINVRAARVFDLW